MTTQSRIEGAPSANPVSDWRETAIELRKQGMSYRAIGMRIGKPMQTVHNAIAGVAVGRSHRIAEVHHSMVKKWERRPAPARRDHMPHAIAFARGEITREELSKRLRGE